MAQGEIRHTGRVVSIFGTGVEVAVAGGQTCASCRMKGACGTGRDGENIIIVNTSDNFAVGDEVEVSIRKTMGFRAVFYIYVLPFLLVFFSLVALVQSGAGDAAAGGTALGILALYYVLLFIFRKNVGMEVNFEVRKL